MTTRKALLISGLALAVAAQVSAGERSRASSVRGTERTPAAESSADATSRPGGYQMVAPGVARAEVGGSLVTVRHDGAVGLDEVMEQYGSVGRYVSSTVVAKKLSAKSREGDIVFADGSIGHFEDFTPTKVEATPKSAEEYKRRMEWSSMAIGSSEMLVFADGSITRDDSYVFSEPAVMAKRRNVLHARDGSDIIYADGTIARDEPGMGRQ